MFGKKKENTPQVEQPKEKPTPDYLRDDYPYKAVGEPIANMDELADSGVIYEIKCTQCEMAIRSQGKNIKNTYQRLMDGNSCIGCGNKNLIVRQVDMSGAPIQEREEKQ